jgi:hypothetical protein
MLICTTAIAMAPDGVARADSPCARVLASPDLQGPWLDAVHELERRLAELPVSDCQAATLRVEPSGAAARIVAETPDGRRAERVVKQASSLVATGLGLVMAIPSVPAATAPPASPASPPPPPTSASAVTLPALDGAAPPPATAAREPHLGLWLGFDLGGRTAVPASVAAADVAAHADLLLGHWILGVSVRYTPVGYAPAQGFDDDAFREVDVGLGVGRRVTVGDTAFDFIAAPAITAMRLEWDFPGHPDTAGEDVEFAINAQARVAVSLSKDWALTLTLESELVPGNLTASPARIEVPVGVPASAAVPPPFPAWMGGIRLGAMGAVL